MDWEMKKKKKKYKTTTYRRNQLRKPTSPPPWKARKHTLATGKQPLPPDPRWREKLFGRRGRKQINETAASATRSDRGCENVFTAC